MGRKHTATGPRSYKKAQCTRKHSDSLDYTLTMAHLSQTPFRLLDLPTELRLVVYEHISIVTRHYTISSITLVVRSLPVSLLASSCHIFIECRPILASKLRDLHFPPNLYYLVSKARLQAFRFLSKQICSTENTARQHGWRMQDQVTIATESYVYESKSTYPIPYNEAEAGFIIKCAILTALRSPPSLLVSVQKQRDAANPHILAHYLWTDLVITGLLNLPLHGNRRVEMKVLARDCFRETDWDVQVTRLQNVAQSLGATFGLATEAEEDVCRDGEVVEMG
jgi:hypothetical protein